MHGLPVLNWSSCRGRDTSAIWRTRQRSMPPLAVFWSTVFKPVIVACVLLALSEVGSGQATPGGYDEILDLNVRDGMVYYRALKANRGRLDAFVSGLGSQTIDQASRNEQIAFWLNAYNAIV